MFNVFISYSRLFQTYLLRQFFTFFSWIQNEEKNSSFINLSYQPRWAWPQPFFLVFKIFTICLLDKSRVAVYPVECMWERHLFTCFRDACGGLCHRCTCHQWISYFLHYDSRCNCHNIQQIIKMMSIKGMRQEGVRSFFFVLLHFLLEHYYLFYTQNGPRIQQKPTFYKLFKMFKYS